MSFNTKNLICHLKNRHPEVHKQWQEANAANVSQKAKRRTAAAAAVRSPVQQVLDQSKKFAKDSTKARRVC